METTSMAYLTFSLWMKIYYSPKRNSNLFTFNFM